jgi:hypothetical protein
MASDTLLTYFFSPIHFPCRDRYGVYQADARISGTLKKTYQFMSFKKGLMRGQERDKKIVTACTTDATYDSERIAIVRQRKEMNKAVSGRRMRAARKRYYIIS